MRKKNIHKIIVAFMLVISVLFIFGCKSKNGTEPQVIEYHKGTDALVMSFVKGAPPDELWQNNEFGIAVELKNKGASSIENGILTFSGHDTGYISITPISQSFFLQGKSPSFPEGDYALLTFSAKNINLPPASKEYTDSIIARAQYDYQTDASIDVCINPFIYNYAKAKEGACQIKDKKISGGQGAPIAITEIKETISPVGYDQLRIEFRITIKNQGSGKVVSQENNNGPIIVEEVMLEGKSMNCNPTELNLEEGEDTFSCSTILEKSVGAYTAPLSIKLSYTYSSQINKIIKVTTLDKDR